MVDENEYFGTKNLGDKIKGTDLAVSELKRQNGELVPTEWKRDSSDTIGDSEPDMDAPKKKRGGKVSKVHGGKPKERLDKRSRGGGEKWIQGAIKHPGAEKKAAAKAGVSTNEYMEEHKHDSGKAGSRARLGLTLSKMAKNK